LNRILGEPVSRQLAVAFLTDLLNSLDAGAIRIAPAADANFDMIDEIENGLAEAQEKGVPLYLHPGVFRISRPLVIDAPTVLIGAGGILSREGPLPLPPTRLLVDEDVDAIVIDTGGGGSSIRDIGIFQGGTAGAGTGRGVVFKETLHMSGFTIADFGGHGLIATLPVANEQCYSTFSNGSIFNCDDNIHLLGGPHTFHGITTLNSRGRGVFVDSAFGSEFFGILFRSCNPSGRALVAHSTVQTDGSHFFGCVIGGGNGDIEIHRPSIMVGGRQTVGFTANSDGEWLGGDANGWSPGIPIVNKRGASTLTRSLGVHNSNQIVDQLQAGANSPWQLKWQEAATQMEWQWLSEGLAAAFAMTDDSHILGRGMLRMRRGFYRGLNADENYETTGSAAPNGASPRASGNWEQGDIVWNSSPTAGGNVGWVCTADGNPGTWKTFGVIAS
jgi:hypothetical protein